MILIRLFVYVKIKLPPSPDRTSMIQPFSLISFEVIRSSYSFFVFLVFFQSTLKQLLLTFINIPLCHLRKHTENWDSGSCFFQVSAMNGNNATTQSTLEWRVDRRWNKESFRFNMENKHSSVRHPWENCQAMIKVNTAVALFTYPLKKIINIKQINLKFIVEFRQA